MSIKIALLVLLQDEPRSASQLQQDFAAATEEIWPLNIGQVTQTLGRLQRDELIESAGTITGPTGHTAEVYRLTPTGQQTATQWWSSPVLTPATERDELVTKVSLAARRPEIDLISVLDEQRNAVIAELRELNRNSRALPDSRTADRLLHERRIFLLEAQASWLDRVESLAAPDFTPPPPPNESEV
ncbi:PadR family transcriptional regulator [Corynebacterium sp. A21]|uniref:PadR family transcriptional regulator n=1 Tax=Corynebacterium sp. A21 TaxID=3457318 RepID=UPI003FD0FA20